MFTLKPRQVDPTVCAHEGGKHQPFFYIKASGTSLPFPVETNFITGLVWLGCLPSVPPTHAPFSPLSTGLHSWFGWSYVLERRQRLETLFFPSLCTPLCLWYAAPLASLLSLFFPQSPSQHPLLAPFLLPPPWSVGQDVTLSSCVRKQT